MTIATKTKHHNMKRRQGKARIVHTFTASCERFLTPSGYMSHSSREAM